MTVGQRVTYYRERRGWSMGALAAKSDVSTAYISRLERGVYKSPGSGNIQKLARALGVDAADLYDDSPLMPAPTVGRVLRTDDLELPVYRAHAGRLDLGPQGPLDTFTIRSQQMYAVEVVGDCLCSEGVEPGDMLIIDRSREPSPAQNIVVARVGDQVYLACWEKTNGTIRLELSEGDVREFAPGEIELQGVAVYVVKRVGRQPR